MTSAAPHSPPSLKGIVSTNDDPDACAVCSGPFPEEMAVNLCCGKRVCIDCLESERAYIGAGRSRRCTFCSNPPLVGGRAEVGALKKHAKKGAAWAQFFLGHGHDEVEGRYVPKSDYGAKRWYEKAAKQRHPRAMYFLGRFCLEGRGGCSVDLSKARQLTEQATNLDFNDVGDYYQDQLFRIAERVDGVDEVKAILIPLAEGGMALAQNRLGCVLCDENRIATARQYFTAAALQGDRFASCNALMCCEEVQNMPEVSFWFNIVSKPGMMPEDVDLRECVEDAGRQLRQLRNNCGGCDVGLVGDRRQYCKQCKTYCYCSRACQKLHWNRVGEEGHRSECMGVQALKEKWKAARNT